MGFLENRKRRRKMILDRERAEPEIAEGRRKELENTKCEEERVVLRTLHESRDALSWELLERAGMLAMNMLDDAERSEIAKREILKVINKEDTYGIYNWNTQNVVEKIVGDFGVGIHDISANQIKINDIRGIYTSLLRNDPENAARLLKFYRNLGVDLRLR